MKICVEVEIKHIQLILHYMKLHLVQCIALKMQYHYFS
jgi:hypothetical protein